MKKKILSYILSFTLVFTALVSLSSANFKASAVTYTADTTWYDAKKSVLVIKDIPDFVAFMNKLNELGTTDNGKDLGATGNLGAISWTGKMPFEGQTILLENDIVLNPGITFSSSGPSTSGAHCFNRTGNQIGFGGIFDGQGHTISGLYISSTKGTGGSIFGVVGAATKYPASPVIVKNLQIKNSYITTTATGASSVFSSVAYNANAIIENVYSSVHLNSNTASTELTSSNMGGFCATVGGNLTIDNCVYAGTMTIGANGTSYGRKHIGGFAGIVASKSINSVAYRGNLKVLASGYYGSFSSDKAEYMGKIVGEIYANCTVTVKNSILGGYMKSTSANMMGSSIGCANSGSKTTLTNVAYIPMKNGTKDVTRVAGSGSDTVTGTPVQITDSSIKGAKTSLGNGLDAFWIPNSDASGYALPLGIVSNFTAESIKHNYLTHLPSTKNALLNELGEKKSSSAYTASSYSQYSTAYDAIVTSINSSSTDLGALNISTLKANAEEKLVTVTSVRTQFLNTLGSKIANNNQYTAASYAEYSSTYDAIVNEINNAGENVESIDVATLKANAEAKLVAVDTIKATLLSALGEKKANNNQYTTASYAEYSSTYDAIVNEINNAGAEVESIDVSTLKANAEAKLVPIDLTKEEILSILGEKISNANGTYTTDSYTEYSSAYDLIVSAINNTVSTEELNNIDVLGLKSAAEAKLVTVLSVKKAEMIALLGVKIANEGEIYTIESYSSYSFAFDTITYMIDSADSVSAIDSIDVLALKQSAEAILVKVYIPSNPSESDTPEADTQETDAPETDTPETDTPETDAPETDAPETETDKFPEESGCGSCGSSVALSAIALVGIVGASLVVKRKKD